MTTFDRFPLGQAFPAATVLTDVYTCPASTLTVISSVVICNQADDFAHFRIAVAPGGTADAPEHYQAYDAELEAKEFAAATLGITLHAGDVVRVYSEEGTVSFSLYGEEQS